MKYVVFEYATIIYIPVVVPECCAHSQIKIKGGRAVSAGFFSIDHNGVITVSGSISESLKLGPNVWRDTKLLSLMLSGITATSCYLMFNFD